MVDFASKRYLERIRVDWPIAVDLDTLTALQLAHLRAVPFENLMVYAGQPVRTDDDWTYDKVVNRRRGGWCFEINGAFAHLLESLGFDVKRLGAAVLLGGPSAIVDHEVLEVQLDQPYLVEVGFGDDAPIVPLPLQQQGPIETRCGTFEFIESPQGTTLSQLVDGVPEARYRFKRVSLRQTDFEPASQRLQSDKSLVWHEGPFATRLLDDQGTRMTLTKNGLKIRSGQQTQRQAVEADAWSAVLLEHFGIDDPIRPN